jgi:arylsulfatase A-like enzyme
VAGLAPPSPGFEPTVERLEAVNRAFAAGAPEPLAVNDLAWATALYDAEVHRVDAFVGELVAELRRLGLDRRATVVLVSDHGVELGEHGRLLHESLHVEVARVPLILRLPGAQKAAVVGKTVETVDLVPTLLELTGTPVPAAVQGRSLVPFLLGIATPPYRAFGETGLDGGCRFASLDDYRLLAWATGDRVELYNLGPDPLEQQDLAAAEPQRIEVLRRQLAEWQTRVAQTAFGPGAAQPLAEDTLKQLKSLGYVQ